MQFTWMRRFIKIILALVILVPAIFTVVRFYGFPVKFKDSGKASHKTAENPQLSRLKTSAVSLRKFIQKNHFNEKICFIADMSLPSGMNRFFVFDLIKDSVLLSGLVAHGSCDNGFQPDPGFSNKVNSGCTCTGKFRIGNSYTGKFGLAYKLYGLDSTNDHAFERNIVLHAYKCVPEKETYPLLICNSRGCPMVSENFLQKLKLYIENSESPILLNIFK